jgi:hypothetical protein
MKTKACLWLEGQTRQEYREKMEEEENKEKRVFAGLSRQINQIVCLLVG